MLEKWTSRAYLLQNVKRLLGRKSPDPLAPFESKYLKNVRLAIDEESGNINHHEYSLFSQDGADGILDYIFQCIGTTNKTFVEFGFHASQNNSCFLIKKGFHGLFIDGDGDQVERFAEIRSRFFPTNKTRAVKAFLTLDNVNQEIEDNLAESETDFLSVDVDGNDFWFWQAITAVTPRVVCIEVNASLGRDRALTVPYDASFERHAKHASGWYHGTSLLALQRLAVHKGYRLVGMSNVGINAFFVRNDVELGSLSTQSVAEAFKPNYFRLCGVWSGRGRSPREQYDVISDLPYVEIDEEYFKSE